MKVLVATEATQGARGDDYSWATPGELVMFGAVCATDLRGTGEPCGCGRAFAGLHSERATTTAEVAESALTLDDLVLAFRDSLGRGGWLDLDSPQEVTEVVHEAVMETLLVADRYPVGTVIGTHLGTQYVRQEAPALCDLRTPRLPDPLDRGRRSGPHPGARGRRRRPARPEPVPGRPVHRGVRRGSGRAPVRLVQRAAGRTAAPEGA